MSGGERAVAFACGDDWLLGVLHQPAAPQSRGVLIVVGGPQYRAGSHRQFALLARELAARGVPVFRFDYRGMGDSTGAPRDFEHVASDLGAAVEAFFGAVASLREIVIWGLCDAASATLFYAHGDPRVSGIALLNPWVRTAAGEARAYLRHYYLQRFLSGESWRRLVRGELHLGQALGGIARHLRQALHRAPPAVPDSPAPAAGLPPVSAPAQALPERMADGLARFDGRVLLVLSGNDLTAREFMDAVTASRRWRRLLASPRITRRTLPEATHTFSRGVWRQQVADWTAEWVRSW